MKYYKAHENIDFEDGQYVITSEQTIGADFWNRIEAAKEEFDLRSNGYIQVASIPDSLANKWKREGFDVFSPDVTGQDILDRLRKEEMTKFIISGDKTF